MKNIEFKYTWCDYLTTCKHFPDNKPEYDVCDTKKYFDIYTGTVECNF